MMRFWIAYNDVLQMFPENPTQDDLMEIVLLMDHWWSRQGSGPEGATALFHEYPGVICVLPAEWEEKDALAFANIVWTVKEAHLSEDAYQKLVRVMAAADERRTTTP